MGIPDFLINIWAAFFTALIVSVAIIKPVIRFAVSRGFVANRQYPGEEGRRVPCFGGIAVCGGFLAGCLVVSFWMETLLPELFGCLLGAVIMLMVGIYDDVKETRPLLKIFGELCAIFVVMSFGVRMHVVMLPAIVNDSITVMWFLFLINAFNFLDILDGLAAGIGIAALGAFCIVSLLTATMPLAVAAASLIGGLIAFLEYNRAPARIYLGDTGSLFLGFMTACISLGISYAPLGREIALLTPIVILGLPIFDTVFVIIVRVRNKRSPFLGSLDHIGLRLMAAGMKEREAVRTMWIAAVFFGLAGLIISRISNLAGIIMCGIIVVLCVSASVYLNKIRFYS